MVNFGRKNIDHGSSRGIQPYYSQNVRRTPGQGFRNQRKKTLGPGPMCWYRECHKALEDHGYNVVSVDVDARWGCTKVVDLLRWGFQNEIPPKYFDIVVATPLVRNIA